MIVIQGVSKRFGKRVVLDGFDFSLVPGQVTVQLGRNGAGKSTLLRLCIGVLKPDAGRVEVCGNDPVRRPRDVRRIVGYVPDKPDVYDWMTPRELLRFLEPQYPTWNRDRAARTAEQLSVPLDTPFRALSRGEGMKAMLVAAVAPDPALLLLDEPFAGLDPVARDEVLRGVIRAGEQTILCATHDLDVAARIADRVAVLSRGRIAAEGPVEEVVGAGGGAPGRMRLGLEAAWLQWLLFAALGVVLLAALRRRLRSRKNGGPAVDGLVGELAIPGEDLATGATGRADLRGAPWTAINDSGAAIRGGQRCRVSRAENHHLHPSRVRGIA